MEITNYNEISAETEEIIDPINDIIDYLVRCANISFKNAHLNEKELRTSDKIQIAFNLFKQSPLNFLEQFGKYLTFSHLVYFDSLSSNNINDVNSYRECIKHLKIYHSDKSRHKRVRNRRYKALQKLQDDTDYFSEKQMMFRNPLLYEQLVGQFLTDEEIRNRDGVDRENLTFVNMILETVDRNQLRIKKNEQLIEEDIHITKETNVSKTDVNDKDKNNAESSHHWGEFVTSDPDPNVNSEIRSQSVISAPERKLLKEEFVQEMYSSFIEGRDTEVDYNDIDNNEQFDDLVQLSRDAEDKYFDSEQNDIENLEEHMELVAEYPRKNSADSLNPDSLDIFMEHISRPRRNS